MADPGSTVRVSGEVVVSPTLRKKCWHESKQLRKRAAFLLEDVTLIPADICFRIGQGSEVQDIHGHKIFFALASPVFHAMLYGDLKEQKSIVEIPDVTPEAFQCLKSYIYSDSHVSINCANVLEVLLVSKKYLVSKLKRFCYHYIQSNLTAASAIKFWCQAREIADEIVEKQCVAEIKRHASRAILSDPFLSLSMDFMLEMTSWSDLRVAEYELYQRLRVWKTSQESNGNTAVKFTKDTDGVLHHIRFGSFSATQLATGPVQDEVLCFKELQQLYMNAFAAKGLTIFPTNQRNPVPASFQLMLKCFMSRKQARPEEENMRWKLFTTVQVEIWPDVAPKACQVLRQYVEGGTSIELDCITKVDRRVRVVGFPRKLQGVSTAEEAVKVEYLGEKLEEESALWAVPGSVCFRVCAKDRMPRLTLLDSTLNRTDLGGKEPESVFGKTCPYGAVVVKAKYGSAKFSDVILSESLALGDYGFDEKDKSWSPPASFAHFSAFECILKDW